MEDYEQEGGTQRLETASTPGLGLKACTCHHADETVLQSALDLLLTCHPKQEWNFGNTVIAFNYHHPCLRLCQKLEVTK